MQPPDAQATGAMGARRAMRPTVRALVAVGAAICAIAPGAAASARVDPTPAPLWRAYPLDDQVRPGGTSTIDRAAVADSGRVRPGANRSPGPAALAGDPGRDPLSAAVVGVLAGLAFALALMAVPAARGAVVRRLARARGARPGGLALRAASPSGLPAVSAAKTLLALEPHRTEADPVAVLAPSPAEREQCEIVWWTSDDGAQFRAIGRNRAGRLYVAARSPALGDPRPPVRDGETLEAWRALVANLHKRGWTPQGPTPSANGTPWYAQRFERPRRPAREPARAAGGRA